MKKMIALILLLLFTVNGYSQKKKVETFCATDELMTKAIRENPMLQQYFDEMDANIVKSNTAGHKSLQSEQGMITIPIVVYIVHKGTSHPSNISDNQVQSQIEALNEHFNLLGIQFCLATKYMGSIPIPELPGTSQTPGIIHIEDATLSDHNMDTDMEALGELPFNMITPDKYLRIWVVNSISSSENSGTIMGYATFPGTSIVFDGIVMRYNVFGDGTNPLCSGCNLETNHDKGKILAHEMGHYLGLYHTFHGGCSGMTAQTCGLEGDRVCDTPPSKNPNQGCLSLDSCIEENNQPDDKHNFMDYGNDNCINHFTSGQAYRMWALLNTYRSGLFTTDNLIYTGTCGSENLLSATFSADPIMICSGDFMEFTPVSIGSNITYQWDFGDPSSGTNNTSTLQNPVHTYNSEGFYTVTLTVSNGSESTIATQQFFVTACNPIINSQSNWYLTESNMLDFSSGVPVSDNNFPSRVAQEGCAVQSNESGELLFYTNGVSVWNNANVLINTNNPLFGSTQFNYSHGKRGVLIVPDPGDPDQYYIFTLHDWGGAKGFRYSIVDVNGVTATMSGIINEPVTIPSGYITGDDGALIGGIEGITAVPHCNGYWIITALKKASYSSLVVYSLASSGLSFNSELDFPLLTNEMSATGGSVKISPDGNKLLLSLVNDLENSYLFDFNKNNGTIGETYITLPGAYGTAFSPNSNILYLNENGKIFQYNLNSTDIPATKIHIGTIINNNMGLQHNDMQLGPDNKIYMRSPSNTSNKQLGVIHSPDELVSESNLNACNFSLNGPIVKTYLYLGLPNMIDVSMESGYNNTITATPVNCLTYKFFANICTDNFSWNFGDLASGVDNTSSLSNPEHTFSAPGEYTVTVTSGSTTITYELTVGISEPEISGSDTACLEVNNLTNSSITLLTGQTVIWSITGGSGNVEGLNNQSNFIVNWSSLPGIVSATVTDKNGCTATVYKTIYEDCDFDIIEDCDGDILTLTSSTISSETYRMSDKITTQGNYFVGNNYTVNLFAGNVVEIKPNSYIRSDTRFLAGIEICIPSSTEKRKNDDIEVKVELFISPNPTKDYINTEIVNDTFKNIRLFSIDGKLLLEDNNLKEANNYLLDLSYHTTGVYILKIYTFKGDEIIRKIVRE